jgi:hypothetical protein
MDLAPLHPDAWLKGIARESQAELPIVAHTPAKEPAFLADGDRMSFTASYLVDMETLEFWDLLRSQDRQLITLS